MNGSKTKSDEIYEGGVDLYRIAICDDEINTCNEIEHIIQESSLMVEYGFDTDVFYSGETLIHYLELGKEYDFLILDIELAELSGIGIGKYLREDSRNFHTQIIFISSKDTYAMQLFAVQPLDFLVKPIKSKTLTDTIKRGLEIMMYSEDFFVCKSGKEHITLNYKEILYLTSNKRIISVVCRDEIVRYYGKLSQELKKLPDCFVQIHNSYIINLNAVKKSGRDYVLMNNGDNISITRKYSEIFKERMLLRWRKFNGGTQDGLLPDQRSL